MIRITAPTTIPASVGSILRRSGVTRLSWDMVCIFELLDGAERRPSHAHKAISGAAGQHRSWNGAGRSTRCWPRRCSTTSVVGCKSIPHALLRPPQICAASGAGSVGVDLDRVEDHDHATLSRLIPGAQVGAVLAA